MDERKNLAVTVGASAVAAGLAAFAAYGSPPYGFFSPFKWLVAIAAVAVGYLLFKRSPWTLLLSLPLAFVGWVHLTGKMHREQWHPWNEWAVVLFSLAGAVAIGLAVAAARGRVS